MSTALEQFAQDAGVTLFECDPTWGGKIGYTTKDDQNRKICGFRTEKAAYKYWLIETFGKHTSKAILKLLKSQGRS